jgi:hypothetical protein
MMMMMMMMKAVSTYETSVSFYQTAQRNIPENSHLHNRHSEKVKFYKFRALQNGEFRNFYS